MHFLGPVVLDYTVNGRVAGMRGHDSDRACPHGTFACAGVERYVAIAVEDAAQWSALRELVPALPGDEALDAPDRADRAKRESWEAALAAWTARTRRVRGRHPGSRPRASPPTR